MFTHLTAARCLDSHVDNHVDSHVERATRPAGATGGAARSSKRWWMSPVMYAASTTTISGAFDPTHPARPLGAPT